MKRISYWAKDHKVESRIIITIIYFFLIVAGIFVGKLLKELNVSLSEGFLVCLAIATALLWLFYPDHFKATRQVSPGRLYVQKKIFHFSAGLVTFLLIIFAGNVGFEIKQDSVHAAIVLPKVEEGISSNQIIKKFIDLIRSLDVNKLSKKEKLKIIRNEIRSIKKNSHLSDGEKVGLIALTVIISLFLLVGLAQLSCSIYCNGAGALAAVVLFAGAFFLILFTVRMIKKIYTGKERVKKKDKRPKEEVTPKPEY